jgi:hypothetical protein
MKALKISLNQWQKILVEISKHHPRSVWMVRPKMRRVLGFTPREHTEWIEDGDIGSKHTKTIHLDFYDESKRTMFMLKYSDFINADN